MCDNVCIEVNETVENISIEVRDFSVLNIISQDAGNSAVVGSDGLLYVPPSVGGVTSVFARVGGVVAEVGDYDTSLVTEVADKKYVTDAEKVTLASTSGTNTGDQDLSGFVKKSFAQSYVYPDITGADASIPIPASGASQIVLSNALLTSIACLDLTAIIGNPGAEVPYPNKIIEITNETGNPIELKHGTGAGIQFITKDALSITIPNKESVFVEYDGTNAKELFRSFVTTSQKTITTNTTLDSTYNNCIVKVKGTATITIPSGLINNFNCVFDVWTGATATFAVSGGSSINATLGSTLAAGKMATLYKDGSTNVYRLRGEIS